MRHARRSMLSVPEQLEILKRGTVTIHSEKELADKLARGKPLRIKLGVDPTSPDIHLGHASVCGSCASSRSWAITSSSSSATSPR